MCTYLKIPGPSIFSFLKNIKLMKKDPIEFGNYFIKKYGDIIQFRIGPMKVVSFNLAEDHLFILKENYLTFEKSQAHKKMSPILGNGLLTAPHHIWQQNRKIINPAFSTKNLEKYFEIVKNITKDNLNILGNEYKGNIYPKLMEITLLVISKALFQLDTLDKHDEINNALEDFLIGMEKRIYQIIPFSHLIPIPSNLKYKKSVKYLKNIVEELLKIRTNNNQSNDMISLFLQSSQKKGFAKINIETLKDEIMTFFVAGHRTSANTLAWTLYLLAKNPHELLKLEKEIQEKIKNDDFLMSDLNQLKHLDNCLNESLRLYPSIWINSRKANKDIKIKNYLIKKNTTVIVSSYFIHRNHKYFDNPNDFVPNRFNQPIEPGSFSPFGLGPRSCIGENFGKMEIKTILILILQKYKISITDDFIAKTHATLSLHPLNGIELTLEKRQI